MMPALETITLSPGGKEMRTIPLSKLVIPDARPVALAHHWQPWGAAIWRFYGDLCHLLFAARLDTDRPLSIWVPDLWHARDGLSVEHSQLMLSMWHTGRDLVRHCGMHKWPDARVFADSAGMPGQYHYSEEAP